MQWLCCFLYFWKTTLLANTGKTMSLPQCWILFSLLEQVHGGLLVIKFSGYGNMLPWAVKKRWRRYIPSILCSIHDCSCQATRGQSSHLRPPDPTLLSPTLVLIGLYVYSLQLSVPCNVLTKLVDGDVFYL